VTARLLLILSILLVLSLACTLGASIPANQTPVANQTAEPAEEDSDLDGLSDTAEVEIGTDPLNPDSDGDGLSDGDEISHGTDPINPDSDADGVPDGVDVDPGIAPTPIVTPFRPMSTPDLNTLMAEALGNLAEGQMVFNPPTEVQEGERKRIELRIIPMQRDVAVTNDAEAGAEARAVLGEGLTGEGEPQFSQVKVGTLMKAKLTGDGFEITPLNEEEQVVGGEEFTQWAWDIVAVETGDQELNLTVTVKVVVDTLGERVRDLPVITQKVVVKVDLGYSIKTFVSEYWQWLVTVLLLPVLGWAWRLYSKSKAKREESEKRKASFFE
jgi:hypothetical protein